jgi:hypothetical protein
LTGLKWLNHLYGGWLGHPIAKKFKSFGPKGDLATSWQKK